MISAERQYSFALRQSGQRARRNCFSHADMSRAIVEAAAAARASNKLLQISDETEKGRCFPEVP